MTKQFKGAMTSFRSEKNTNWEGAFRVPCLVRWPKVIAAGTVTNELMSHNDWVPTLCSIAGEPDIVAKLRKGYTANGSKYTVHLDGHDQSEFLRRRSKSFRRVHSHQASIRRRSWSRHFTTSRRYEHCTS